MQTIAQVLPTATPGLTTQPRIGKYPEKFVDWLGFKTFGDPELDKLVQGGWEWVQAFKTKSKPIWLSTLGKCGTGKTHCAERLFRWAAARADWSCTSYIGHTIYWPDFVQKLRAGDSFNKREDLKRWPVLLLDDVGAERDTTGFAQEELNTLLGCRMNQWTLLTSNLNFEQLQVLDGRIASRLIRGGNICVGVNTNDYASR